MCLLILVFLFVSFFCSYAQRPYSLVHYDETILPQTSIGNIQQDKYGYLWMNTQFGIVRYDGKEFKTFTTGNTKGLSSNRIRLCAADSKGDIYFLDENLVVLEVNSPNHFKVATDNELYRSHRYVIWSTSPGSDISFRSFGSQTAYRQFLNRLGMDRRREMLKCYATGQKAGYFFYLDTTNKVRLCYYEDDRYTTRRLDSSFHEENTFSLHHSVFYQNTASRATLFTGAESMQSIQVTGLPSSLTHLFTRNSGVLFSNRSGTFLYAEGKLYEYKWVDNSIIATLLFDNLPCTGVNNIMKEQSTGDIFIGTKNSGVYRVRKNQFSVIDFTSSNKGTVEKTGVAGTNIIYAIAFWNRNSIFSGGYTAPLTGKGRVTAVSSVVSPQFNLYFLGADDSSYLFMERNFSLVRFNTTNNTYQTIGKTFHPLKVLPTVNGRHLLITNHEVQVLTENSVISIGRNDSITFTTAETISENCLLLGSGKGLFYFYPDKRKWQPVSGSESLKVRYIYKDRRSKVWIATYGQGLYFLSGNSLIPIPLDNAGYLSIAHSIAEDKSGNFWIPTNHGLFKIQYSSLLSVINSHSHKLSYTYFDKTDGFGTNEFNGGCSPAYLYKKETGYLFFPSMNGVLTFNPDSVKAVTSNSSVVFDEMVVNDSLHLSPGVSPSLKSNASSIRILFSSPYFGHDANIKFSYSLNKGEWKDLGNSRSILLSNLPGGGYTLMLKKEEASGNPVITSLPFDIEKKITETIWFKVLAVLAIAAVVYLFFTARLRYLHRERRRLEKEVAARTADQQLLIGKLNGNIETLTQLQDELSVMIAHKENIIAVLIHDIKSPLHFLNTVATYLNKTIDTNPIEKNREIIHEIANSLNQLYLFAQDYTMWLNITNQRIMGREKVSLQKVTDEVKTIYQESVTKKGIDLEVRIAADTLMADEPMLKSLVRNLVDNAIKHTSYGVIAITTMLYEELFEIQVTDEGKGMTAEQVAELNAYFGSESDGLSFSSGQFGHKIIKDFLRKMEGRIQYALNVPSGIKVTVTFPIAEESVNSVRQSAAIHS